MSFWKTVAAYLTGWVIAQSTFSRLWRFVMRKGDIGAQGEFVNRLAVAILDEQSRRSDDFCDAVVDDKALGAISALIYSEMQAEDPKAPGGAYDYPTPAQFKECCRKAFEKIIEDGRAPSS